MDGREAEGWMDGCVGVYNTSDLFVVKWFLFWKKNECKVTQ